MACSTAARPIMIALACALTAGCAAMPPPKSVAIDAAMLSERAIPAPGFADFLVVDGAAVWVTNRGRVEKWSRERKLASVAMPRPCGTMALAARALWVAECTRQQVYRIAPDTGVIEAMIATGLADPRGETNVVAGAGSIFVASDPAGKIARIDPVTNAVVAEIAVVPGTAFLAFGYDALWAVSSAGQVLQKIDPATNAVVGTAALGTQPGFLAAGEGAVWVQEQGDGTVAKVNPDTLRIEGRTKVGANLKYGDIDTGGGAVWLRTTDDQTMVVIDPASLAIRARLGKPSGSGAVRFTPSGVWTSAHDNETISWWSVPAGSK